MIKVSIITPIYKVASFIEKCAVSLFEQTYSNIEYVFIDDCTPDESVELLMTVLDKYPSRKDAVKLVRHQYNRGVSAARNTGLDNVTGDYVYSVDADDWLELDAIENMVNAASISNADIIAVGWYLSFSQNERKMPMPNYTSADDALRAMLGGQMRWNLWLYMIRGSIYSQNNFRFIEGENVGEDMYMLIRLFSRSSSIMFVEKPLYHYIRQNADSITQMSPVIQMKRVLNNLSAAIHYLEDAFGHKYKLEIQFLKLNVKFPLLITADSQSYREWQNYFPESHSFITANKVQSFRSRLLQLMASKRQYWYVKLYNLLILKFIYGVIFR